MYWGSMMLGMELCPDLPLRVARVPTHSVCQGLRLGCRAPASQAQLCAHSAALVWLAPATCSHCSCEEPSDITEPLRCGNESAGAGTALQKAGTTKGPGAPQGLTCSLHPTELTGCEGRLSCAEVKVTSALFTAPTYQLVTNSCNLQSTSAHIKMAPGIQSSWVCRQRWGTEAGKVGALKAPPPSRGDGSQQPAHSTDFSKPQCPTHHHHSDKAH